MRKYCARCTFAKHEEKPEGERGCDVKTIREVSSLSCNVEPVFLALRMRKERHSASGWRFIPSKLKKKKK